MSTDVLTWTERDGAVFATLSRPDVRNAINGEVVARIHTLCDELERDPRILVFTGAGGTFAAGADIRELRERRPEDALRGINSRAFDRIARLPQPTIAVVDGPAIGGGAELAYAFDIRVATPTAMFANPEPGLGIIAAAGACWRLPELVGPSVARHVLLAGRRLSAEEALQFGLVMQIIDADEMDAVIAKLVRRVSASSPLALRLTKVALGAGPEAHPEIDDASQAVLFGSDDASRRMTDFLERK